MAFRKKNCRYFLLDSFITMQEYNTMIFFTCRDILGRSSGHISTFAWVLATRYATNSINFVVVLYLLNLANFSQQCFITVFSGMYIFTKHKTCRFCGCDRISAAEQLPVLTTLSQKYRNAFVISADSEGSDSMHKLINSPSCRSLTEYNLKIRLFMYFNNKFEEIFDENEESSDSIQLLFTA